MPKFKNISPVGDLELPLIGRVVEHGEVIEVSDAQAERLEGQEGTWEPVTTRSKKHPDDLITPPVLDEQPAPEGDDK